MVEGRGGEGDLCMCAWFAHTPDTRGGLDWPADAFGLRVLSRLPYLPYLPV